MERRRENLTMGEETLTRCAFRRRVAKDDNNGWSLTCSETAGTRALVDMVWAAPWWLLFLPARGRCQGGAPDWTNDLDTGEDRRKIGPAREPRVLAQPTGITSCAR